MISYYIIDIFFKKNTQFRGEKDRKMEINTTNRDWLAAFIINCTGANSEPIKSVQKHAGIGWKNCTAMLLCIEQTKRCCDTKMILKEWIIDIIKRNNREKRKEIPYKKQQNKGKTGVA